MDQMPLSGVDFNNVETGLRCTFCCADKSYSEGLDLDQGRFLGLEVLFAAVERVEGTRTSSGHPPTSSVAISFLWRKGATVLDFLPSWLIFMPIFWLWLWVKLMILLRDSIFPPSQRPMSRGVMRPSFWTVIDSIKAKPGPRWMMPPKWARCQSVA